MHTIDPYWEGNRNGRITDARKMAWGMEYLRGEEEKAPAQEGFDVTLDRVERTYLLYF